jgi:hypothetical protein
MNELEFLNSMSEEYDKMDIDNLKRVLKLKDNMAQKYFHNWYKAEEEIFDLKMEIFKLKYKDKS